MPDGDRCGYPHCNHKAHRDLCRGKGPSRCNILPDFTTGEPIPMIVCGTRLECTCPWETCPCGAPVAVANLIPGGAEVPLDRGAYDGDAEVWICAAWLLCSPLAGELPEGRYRGRRHELSCPRADYWTKRRARENAKAAKAGEEPVLQPEEVDGW